GGAAARAAGVRRTVGRVRATGDAGVQRERPDPAAGRARARRGDPAPLGRRAGGRGRGGGCVGGAVAAARHHAGVARGAAVGAGRGGVPRAVARDVQLGRSTRLTASGARTTITSTRRLCTATMNVVFAPAPN